MPELPEVETVVRTLRERIVGKEVASVQCFVPRIARTSLDAIEHQQITGISRRGKYIIFEFTRNLLIVHLRMEGKFYLKHKEPLDKHEHVLFIFTDGSSMRYHDVRKFGTMDVIKPDELTSFFSHLGVEPGSGDLTVSYLKEKVKNQVLKAYLLDQSIIAGLGNIYVNEVMFLMKKHPETKVLDLTDEDFEQMIFAVNKTIQKAISLGGTTIRSYTSSLGVTGRFQNELLVHGKAGEDCPECGTKISKIKVVGRGTYLCELCQARY